MTARFLLDTNVLSEPLRPAPDPRVLARLKRHEDELATAAPVWHELLFGAFRLPHSKRRRAVETYLHEVLQRSLLILPYDSRAAEWHAGERARLAKIGRLPPFTDGQIAAIAAVHDLELVTMNVKDFRAFAGLKVVDWRS
ncbi:MAG: type II toxin-antitoxin system VapC family toxin [Planctomycetes bacterium]|nr:type II toxin-antitoxin system VapC family toxin [Planctomycetota bacterium]